MFKEKKTEEATINDITLSDMDKYGGIEIENGRLYVGGMREDLRAYIERSKRDEDYGVSMIKAVGVMALIFLASLWCFSFGLF